MHEKQIMQQQIDRIEAKYRGRENKIGLLLELSLLILKDNKVINRRKPQ